VSQRALTMPDIMGRLNSEVERIDAWCEKNGHFDKKKNCYDHPYGTPYHHGRRELAVELIEYLKEIGE